MTGHNIEDDADLATNQDEPTPEGAPGPAGDQANATQDGTLPADPGGGDPADSPPAESVTGRPEPTAAKPADAPSGDPADSPDSESVTEGAEGQPPTDGSAPAEGDGEGEASATPVVAASPAPDPQEGKRRRLLAGLAALIVLLVVVTVVTIRYLVGPQPLPDLLPLPVDINYRPHYLFSIYGVEKPVGVAVSPDGERIYATETGGGREIKVFDRDGGLLKAFFPPSTGPSERAPVYLDVDPTGRVFVTDRLQRAVFVYDREGNLLDAILGPDLTLSEYVSKHIDDLQPDSTLAYNLFGRAVRVQGSGQGVQSLPAPEPATWAPLGVRLDEQGTMLLTDVVEGRHAVREFPGHQIMASTWREFEPQGISFGAQGQGNGEFLYPNSAVADSQGRIYVTDGNNGRVSVWDPFGTFLFEFGRGVGESALSLPRGAAMDRRDRLHVVDAVDQSVKVYDVSEPEPRFLFAFGDWGTDDGEFNYPGDIALDRTGRLYIADRENNRIQVWSY